MSVLAAVLGACGDGTVAETTTTTASGQEASTTTGEATTTAGEEPSEEFDAEAYFGQRSITFVVTHSAGGGTDLQARVFAENLGELLPGQPRVEVTNVSSVEGMDLVLTAPDDETIYVGATSQGSGLFEPLLDPEIVFDPTDVQMIGGMDKEPRAMAVVGDAAEAYDGLSDAQGGGDVQFQAGFEAGERADVVAEVLLAPWVCDALELNCEIFVISDDSTSNMVLMMERGEINFNVSSLGSLAREHNDALVAGDAWLGFTVDAEDLDITYPEGFEPPPNLLDLLSEEKRNEFETLRPMVTSGGVQKNYYVGPAVPEEAVEVLREAWDEFVTDEERFEPYARLVAGELGGGEGGIRLPVTPLSGAEVQEIYLPQAETFVENLDTYIQIQEEYFERWYSG